MIDNPFRAGALAEMEQAVALLREGLGQDGCETLAVALAFPKSGAATVAQMATREGGLECLRLLAVVGLMRLSGLEEGTPNAP